MELKWLEDFVMLANTASFSRAAEARHVTQSAFSRRIKQLETWLGAPLVSRASLPAELTAEGRAFLPVAQEMIRTAHGMREALHPGGTAEDRLITFAALHTLTVTFLPHWLDVARRRLPGLTSAIIPDRGGIEDNLDALAGGECDLFVTYAHSHVPFLLDPQQFEWRGLGTERLLPVVAPALAGELGLPGPDLLEAARAAEATLPYLDYGPSSFFGVALQRVFAGAPAPRRRTVHRNTISAGLREMTLAGWGVCWLPEGLVAQDLRSGRLMRASSVAHWALDVEVRVYRHRERHRRIVEQFWQSCCQPGALSMV